MWLSRQWRYLKMVRQASQCHGIHSPNWNPNLFTASCSACHWIGINLPASWRDTSPQLQCQRQPQPAEKDQTGGCNQLQSENLSEGHATGPDMQWLQSYLLPYITKILTWWNQWKLPSEQKKIIEELKILLPQMYILAHQNLCQRKYCFTNDERIKEIVL
ncbi:hypothetical protein C8Q76DRAFT_688635 [Earliella scabrosa]|nr:hypothetical protein C8Q76DRAFT_688635 [Earliella scabrosa]